MGERSPTLQTPPVVSPRFALPAVIAALAGLAPASAPAATRAVSPDGAWTYFIEPRAVNYKGRHRRTFVGWLDSRGQIVVSSYDHRTGVRTRAVLRTGERVDDHNNPSILVRPNGRLFAFYSTHRRRNLVYRRSRRPGDATAWRRERRVPTNAPGNHGYTYPNPMWLAREARPLFLFWRGGGFEPVWSTSRDGASWSPARTLIEGNGQRPYLVYESNGQDRIDIAFSDGNPSETTTSIYYMRYQGGRLEGADGSEIARLGSGPIQPSQADVVYSSASTAVPAWVYDVGVDSDGRPVVLYASFPSATDHRYHYARWTGTTWISRQITASGPTIEKTGRDKYYAGGMVLDSRNPSVVYLSRQVAGVYQVERWQTATAGLSWTSVPVTSDDRGSYRPVSARGPSFGAEHDLFWMSGRYTGWLDFGTAIFTRTDQPGPAANAEFRAIRLRARRFAFRGVGAPQRVWRFGDGTGRARGRRVAHTYARPGRYRVTSTVTPRGGPRDVYIREVRARKQR